MNKKSEKIDWCMRHKKKSGNLTGGFVLITLGIVFILNNLGFLPWNVWETLWKFWPAFLILAGLEILIDSCFIMQCLILLMEVGIFFYLLFKPF